MRGDHGEVATNQIGLQVERNDGDCCCLLPDGEQDVDRKTDQLGREVGEMIGPALSHGVNAASP